MTTITAIEVGFEHTAGGDSKLPANDRGFFDFYTVDVSRDEALAYIANSPKPLSWSCSETEEGRVFDAAQEVAWVKMAEMVAADHPDWVRSAWEDLVAVAANHPERN